MYNEEKYSFNKYGIILYLLNQFGFIHFKW